MEILANVYSCKLLIVTLVVVVCMNPSQVRLVGGGGGSDDPRPAGLHGPHFPNHGMHASENVMRDARKLDDA